MALAIARRGRGVWDTFRRMDMQTRCVAVSGGPAGVMLGLLLARAGAAVVVLEKHADFRRDFRGDSIHPATLQVMHELGFVDEFRSLLQNEITTLDVVIGNRRFTPGRSLHPAGRAVLSGDRFERVVVEHQEL